MQQLLDNQTQMEQMMSQYVASNNNNQPQAEDGHKEIKENIMTGPRACKICGEMGHLYKECHDEWLTVMQAIWIKDIP